MDPTCNTTRCSCLQAPGQEQGRQALTGVGGSGLQITAATAAETATRAASQAEAEARAAEVAEARRKLAEAEGRLSVNQRLEAELAEATQQLRHLKAQYEVGTSFTETRHLHPIDQGLCNPVGVVFRVTVGFYTCCGSMEAGVAIAVMV